MNRCANAHKPVHFGGPNFRSCFDTYKQQLLIKQLSKYDIQVATLCGTGIYDSGVKAICSEWILVHSGMLSQSTTQTAHVKAVCLNRIATIAWKNSASKQEPVLERILRIIIHCSPINITLLVIQGYVNPASKNMADDSDKFYDDLQKTVEQVQKGDMLLIIGDLNYRC